MAQLKLINREGLEIDLSDQKHLMAEITGLGFKQSNTFQTVGNTFFLIGSQKTQNEIKGTMYFKGTNPYAEYFRFINGFVNQDIILEYTTIDTFKLSCRLISSEKKEHTKDYKKADISLIPNGLWYNEKKEIFIPSDQEDDGKTYEYIYSYKYNRNKNDIEINLGSNIESPVRLLIFGPAVNPEWKLYTNGKQVATGKMINFTIQQGQRLSIDPTNPKNCIELQDLNGKTIGDVYRFSDFETDRFIYMRKGVNRMTVAEESARNMMYAIEAKIYYDSV